MSNTLGLSSRDQAQFDANKIMEYWSRRGYEVEAWCEPLRATAQGQGENIDVYAGYVVRTNMVNGFPPKLLEERKRSLLG